VIYGALAVTALPAYLLLAPRSHWSHPWLLVALGAIALVGEVHDIRLTSGIRLDANTAVVVMALAIGGPLPALAVWLLPLVAGATVLQRQRLWRVGNLANLGSFRLGDARRGGGPRYHVFPRVPTCRSSAHRASGFLHLRAADHAPRELCAKER